MNTVFLVGGLTRDPEMRYTTSGTPVTTFSVATSEGFGDKERTEYHNIVVWGNSQKESGGAAGACASYLKKGSKVAVLGKLQTRQWEAQDGQKRRTTEVVVDSFSGRVEFLGGTRTKEEVGAATAGSQSSSSSQETTSYDDIPF